MNNKRLFEIMGDVDDAFVNEAETPAKKTNPRVWISLGAMAACAAVIVTAALTLPDFRPDRDAEEPPTEVTENDAPTRAQDPTERPQEPTKDDGANTPDFPDGMDNGYGRIGGKLATFRLLEAFKAADGPIEMSATVGLSWDLNDYVYEGIPLRQIESLYNEERHMFALMEELIKEGDYLKYGEALCTTGAPDGTRYARELYEERVAYYGELLDKYIVDGEFLLDELKKDMENFEPVYENMFNNAKDASRTEGVRALCGLLADRGFACTVSDSGWSVTVTMTEAQLEALALSLGDDWMYFFDIAHAEDVPMDFTDGAAPDEPHDGPVMTDDNPVMDLGEANSGGKYVTARLREALRETEEPVAMTAGVRGFDWEFVYDGRTLDELQRLCEEVTDVLYKLEELLKDGEYLKYGEAMCTTGAPDGTRYARDHYEYLTAYYGELLDKYIVDGEFLRENVERDLVEKEDVYESFSCALTAYHNERVSTLYRRLSDLGIACAVSENGLTIRLIMTPAEFETLDLTDISGTAPDDSCSWGYVFYLAGAENDPMDTGDIPLPE